MLRLAATFGLVWSIQNHWAASNKSYVDLTINLVILYLLLFGFRINLWTPTVFGVIVGSTYAFCVFCMDPILGLAARPIKAWIGEAVDIMLWSAQSTLEQYPWYRDVRAKLTEIKDILLS